MDMTRRAFVGTSAAAVAGSALGISPEKGRRHGPVKLWTYFLTKDPVIMKANLYASEEDDTFQVHALVRPGYQAIAEMPLSAMRMAVDAGASKSKVIMLVMEEGRKQKFPMPIAIVIEGENVNFIFDDPGFPVWVGLKDVKRVL
jgi:hypothetical protein